MTEYCWDFGTSSFGGRGNTGNLPCPWKPLIVREKCQKSTGNWADAKIIDRDLPGFGFIFLFSTKPQNSTAWPKSKATRLSVTAGKQTLSYRHSPERSSRSIFLSFYFGLLYRLFLVLGWIGRDCCLFRGTWGDLAE